MKVSVILLFAISLAGSFSCFAQSNASYPQGNVIWSYRFANYNNTPPYYSWNEVVWTPIDTVINEKNYTTAATNGFVRYNDQTDQTYFYCSATEMEYNVTRPAALQVGDTIDLTDIIRFLDHGNYEALGLFDAQEINENIDHQVLGVVTVDMGSSYQLNGFKIVDGVNYNANNPVFIHGYTPGVGVHIFHQFSWTELLLKCVFEENEAFSGFDTNCTLTITELTEEEPFIFPNPTLRDFRITTNSNANARITVFDSFGKTVHTENNYLSGQQIVLNDFLSGVYFVQIQDDRGNYFCKLVVE